MSIYVETRIRAPIEEVWRRTQSPDLHERWDLRFSEIQYLHREDESQPQKFLYSTRIGFGIAISGEGESVGSSNAADGIRTSALKFWSDDPKSLIEEGVGYWQYLPTEDGVRFLTSYDYHVRFGRIGRVFDSIVFRPLIGWATAWSFDRLRLWIENGLDPKLTLHRALLHVLATVTVSFVWLYQGIVPKLIARNSDELKMLVDAGVSFEMAPVTLQLVGWCEVVLGALVLGFAPTRWPFAITILLLLLASAGIVVNSPNHLWAAFNPVSLNVLMIAMSIVGMVTITDRPWARNCLRVPPEKRS